MFSDWQTSLNLYCLIHLYLWISVYSPSFFFLTNWMFCRSPILADGVVLAVLELKASTPQVRLIRENETILSCSRKYRLSRHVEVGQQRLGRLHCLPLLPTQDCGRLFCVFVGRLFCDVSHCAFSAEHLSIHTISVCQGTLEIQLLSLSASFRNNRFVNFRILLKT
jgi:hypothetical protein